MKNADVEFGFYNKRAEPVPLGISDNGDSSQQNNPDASRCIDMMVALEKGQLGETYHVPMCRLLLQWNRAEDIRVRVIVQDPQNNEIRDPFQVVQDSLQTGDLEEKDGRQKRSKWYYRSCFQIMP